MKIFFVLSILCSLIFSGCGPSIPDYSPIRSAAERVENFDKFCDYFEEYYPFFQIHHINWDSLKEAYRPLALGAESDREFETVLKDIIFVLKDPHCELIAPNDKTLFSTLYFGGEIKPIAEIVKNMGFLPVSFVILDNAPIVSMVDSNSNAFLSGIRVGMKLESIRNKSLNRFISDHHIGYFKRDALIHHLVNRYIKFGIPGDSIQLGFSNGEDNSIDATIYYQKNRYKSGMEVITDQYTTGLKKLETLHYGWASDSIGYIRIRTFWGEDVKKFRLKLFSWVIDGPANKNLKEFQTALEELSEARGLIIDVRDNSGGNQSIGNFISSYFTDKKSFSNFSRYRDWDFPKDITKFRKLYTDSILPYERWHRYKMYRNYNGQYLKPVVVLQNEGCLSACETFLSSMRHLPNATTLGTASGGSSTNPNTVVLPNGLFLKISSRQTYWDKDQIIERNGVPPEVELYLKYQDIVNNIDIQFEKAVDLLTKND